MLKLTLIRKPFDKMCRAGAARLYRAGENMRGTAANATSMWPLQHRLYRNSGCCPDLAPLRVGCAGGGIWGVATLRHTAESMTKGCLGSWVESMHPSHPH